MQPGLAAAFAALASLCFAAALIATRIGLRTVPPLSGAMLSVGSATVGFWLLVPLTWPAMAMPPAAALAIFAAVGLFFPAAMTLLVFHSNARIGPNLTGAISCTAPIFAILGAWIFLGEQPPPAALGGAALATGGIAMLALSGESGGRRIAFALLLALPLLAALVRAAAQVLSKAGLDLWPEPLGATLIGYSMSFAVLSAAGLARRTPLTALRDGRIARYFVLAGLFNGGAVLLQNLALNFGPVSLVAPILASYPLATLAFGAVLLRSERLGGRTIAGAALTVLGIVMVVLAR